MGVLVHNRCAKLKPDQNAVGHHTTFKTDNITNYATWEPNPKNPSGFQEVIRVDVIGQAHRNPNGVPIPTPHVHPWGDNVRPANPDEIPRWWFKR